MSALSMFTYVCNCWILINTAATRALLRGADIVTYGRAACSLVRYPLNVIVLLLAIHVYDENTFEMLLTSP